MINPKKILFAVLSLILVTAWSLTPSFVFASKQQYFDFGPYYAVTTPVDYGTYFDYGRKVLGFTFSSLENLPIPKIPETVVPSKAEGVMPGSPFYALEKAVENVQVAFTFDPVKKAELRLGFANERLAEAKTLTDQGKSEASAEALADYSRTMTTIAQNLSTLAQGNNPEIASLANKVEEAVASQAVFTQNVSLISTPVSAEYWTQATQAGRNALDEAAKAQGAPAIPEALSTSIQELKKDGLISEEESNKLYSLKSRSEVREELDKLASSGQFPLAELSKLDTAVAEKYPEVQKQIEANLQVVELRSYQTLPQPPDKIQADLEKLQKDPTIPPSNDIKPYLWYNRATDLAKEVDLSHFPSEQQQEVAKFYPQSVGENPTYIAPSPSPATPAGGPSPSPQPATTSQQQITTQPQTADQTASPSPSPAPTAPTAQLYVGATGGALLGDPTYYFKRWNEELSLTFTFDVAQKARLKMQQAEKRLAEATALSTDPKKASLYESTLKNYQQTMNDASVYLKNAPDSKARNAVAQQLEAQAGRHEVVLEKGLLPEPKGTKLLSEAIKATENAMDRSADALDRPALPPLLAQRLGDLKAQGLLLPEEAEDLTRSSSREEVRSKVRKLTEIGTFPPADAKKLDEAQNVASPQDFNQLVEVRKVEELQNLRSVQTDFAQTPTLKAAAVTLSQRESTLVNTIEPSLIKEEDLAGREGLIKTYQTLLATASARPINSGQFGPDAKPGITPAAPITPPRPSDAVLSTCPEGAIFKKSEGCVWADSGKKINDYDQYKCNGPRQYYSFAARKCVPYESGTGFRGDSQPVCPVGYTWSWQTQACQAFTGTGPLPLPTPKPEPDPKDDKEREERSKSCPEGSTYKVPDGCVWDKDGKPIYDSAKYKCGPRQYYSFEKLTCVPAPKEGQEYPRDATPDCKEENSHWSWSDGKCTKVQDIIPFPLGVKEVPTPNVSFVPPGNPFYFLKQAGEGIQRAIAFTPVAREQVSLSQAKERLAEAAYALKKDDEQGVKKALSAYTYTMQSLVGDISREQFSEGAKIEIGKLLSEEAVEQNLLLQKLSVWAKEEQDSAINAAVSVTILGVDKAADIAGEPAIPEDIKAKIEALPEKMITEEEKKKLLEVSSRVEVRVKLGVLAASGGLTQQDTAFLNEDFESVDKGAKVKLEELKKLEEITTITQQKEDVNQKVVKNEEIVGKLAEFEKTFEPGKDIPAEVRPYVRLTRINEVTGTIRPDIVRLEDFSSRKDIQLAVATLQQEFRPTVDSVRKIEEFRRTNPGKSLPFELARVEALSFSLGVRGRAEGCFLPSPPFPANTPCPAPGAAIPITSYIGARIIDEFRPGWPGGPSTDGAGEPSTDKDGKPLVYGQGPKSASAGLCPDGYHWMYDSGGWCMSNSGSYNSSYQTFVNTYSPIDGQTGYTPYSPYYSAPGAPPATYGYQGPGTYSVYPGSYSPPSYYGTAPTSYTTTPPPGTVPGSGPAPTAPGQCPTGFHWMPPYPGQEGWCMSDGPTYVPSGGSGSGGIVPGTSTSETPPPGGYNCGSQSYDLVTKKCKDGACPGGYNWDGSRCVVPSPNLTQGSCGPGYYWSNNSCFPNPTTYATTGGTPGSCPAPSSGCGSNYYWDSGTCSCRSSGTYTGGGGPTPSNYCQGKSCGSGYWLDYTGCTCVPSGSTTYSGGSSGSTTSCAPPSGGCPGGWYDYGTCSCRTSSTPTSTGSTTGSTSTSGSCPSGYHWMPDSGGWCMSDGGTAPTTSPTPSTTTTPSTTSSTGSCPSGSHWMSDSGGYCMSDGGSGTTPSYATPSTESSPAPTSAPQPAPTTAP